MNDWNSVTNAPRKSGNYIVSNVDEQKICQARWKPRSKEWVFPFASYRFDVQFWRELPELPKDNR